MFFAYLPFYNQSTKMAFMKKAKLLLITVALIALALTLGNCESLRGAIADPSVSFDSISLTGINFEGVDLLARIKIENANSFAIPFPEINWDFLVKDSSFLSGTIGNDTRIAARGSTVVELPLNVSYEGLIRTIVGIFGANQAPYRVDLAVRFPTPLLEGRTFSASFDGSIPLLQIPSVSFTGVRFNSVSLSRVEFVLNWQIDNRNIFPVNLDALNYNFVVNNSSWSSGSVPQMSLPAQQVTNIPLTVGINSFSLIQEIVTLATTGRSVNFNCSGEVALSLQPFENLPAIPVVSVPFNQSGTTNLRP